MNVNRKREQTVEAWVWRLLLGPAMLVDGIVFTLTASTVSTGVVLEVSRRLAMARYASMKVRA